MTYPGITDNDTREHLARQLHHWRGCRDDCMREIARHPAFSAERALEIARATIYTGRIAGMRLAMQIIGE